MVPLGKESQATQAKPNSSEHTKPAPFEILYCLHKNPAQFLDELRKAAGFEKVQEHSDQLNRILDLEKLDDIKRGILSAMWISFTKGTTNLDGLKDALGITEEKLGDKTKTLIRCAYFVKFPTTDTSKLAPDQMLARLQGPAAPKNKELNAAQEIKWSAEIVQRGFNETYHGHDMIVVPTLNTLAKFASDWTTITYKAPYTSIIGPTMSGKTRLLKELAFHVCVVYVCLRDAGSTGQPPRSQMAEEFLPPAGQEVTLTDRYTNLLAAIFETVTDFFSRPDISQKKYEDQLFEWFHHSFQMDDCPKTEYNNEVRKHLESPKRNLTKAAYRMHQNLQDKGDDRLSVLLAIDEASNLINPIDLNNELPYFRVFRRVLSEIPSNVGFLCVFSDTNSRVANFNPAISRDPSARHHGFGFKLFAPIYKISTIDAFVQEAPSSWNELLLPQRLFSYGCPFYGLYFRGIADAKQENPVETTVMIAQVKLLMKRPSDPPKLTDPQCFAILGSVIQTRVSLHSPINSELVASHAAHCAFIDESRELIVSEYPPQFVYACAANRVLAANEDRWIECINCLASAVQKGLVALGDAGEMATRLILIRAMQKTKAIPSSKTDRIHYGYSVRLADFLHTLSGKDPSTMRFGCFNDNNENNKTRLLEEGRIFFNHFARISYTPSATDLLELLYRGVAVQCKSRQPGLDELFPIYLAPTSEESPKLDHKNITFCGVQTKNQTGYVDWKQSPNWSKSYANIKGVENPYLILLFSLRTANRKAKQWTNPTDHHDTGRVSYQFLGLDEIACLSSGIRGALQRLISAIPDDLIQLHDEPDPLTEQWVKQLNPVFYQTPRALEQPTPQAEQPTPQTPKPSTPPAAVAFRKPSKRSRTSSSGK